MSNLENIKNRISNKKHSKDYDPIEVWHYFMLSYGYIPLDNFLSMDAGIKEKLVEYINEYNKQMNKTIPKGRRNKR